MMATKLQKLKSELNLVKSAGTPILSYPKILRLEAEIDKLIKKQEYDRKYRKSKQTQSKQTVKSRIKTPLEDIACIISHKELDRISDVQLENALSYLEFHDIYRSVVVHLKKIQKCKHKNKSSKLT